MYIYLSDNIILMAVFVCGLIIGAAVYRFIARPQDALDMARIEIMEELISNFEERQCQVPPKPLHNPHK